MFVGCQKSAQPSVSSAEQGCSHKMFLIWNIGCCSTTRNQTVVLPAQNQSVGVGGWWSWWSHTPPLSPARLAAASCKCLTFLPDLGVCLIRTSAFLKTDVWDYCSVWSRAAQEGTVIYVTVLLSYLVASKLKIIYLGGKGKRTLKCK